MQTSWRLVLAFVQCFALLGCREDRPGLGAAATPSASPSSDAAPPSTASPVRTPGLAFERFVMPGVQGLIVAEASAGQFYSAITGETSPGHWPIEKSQLIDLETRLPAYLREKAPPNSRPQHNLRSFRRQYIGIIRGKERVIFTNFFCETNHRDWTRKPIAVVHGGDCYFQLEFDPVRHRFFRLHIQAER